MQAYSAFAEKGRVRIALSFVPCPLSLVCQRQGTRDKGQISNPAALLLIRQDVQPALLLRGPRPPAGPLVLAGHHRPCARPAADARVVAVVEGIVRNVVLVNETPNVFAGPG